MSRSFSAPRWGTGVVLAGALAFVLMALLAVAPRANAVFAVGKCAGEDTIGRGASFARDAHKVFNFNFANNYCIGTPGFESLNVTYESQGSGKGIEAVINRGLTPRFGMSDDPPEPAQMAEMNAGDVGPGDDGQIHVIPAAVGAVAPLVNFPNDCDPKKLPAASRTIDPITAANENLVRVRFTKEQFEKAWAKDPSGDEWDEVFPSIKEGACENEPIMRIVRFDKSGTTFAFKDYLNTINPSRGWISNFTADNREWPNAVLAHPNTQGCAEAAAGSQPDNVDFLTTACATGNDDLTIKLVATDGSIGYSDISTARTNNPSLAIDPTDVSAPFDNDVYWTQAQNGSNTFTEPTASPEGYLEKSNATFPNGGTKGSNCQAATFTNVPATTLADWSDVSGVNAPSGYAVCTMTYGLVFDDNADVWGNTQAEELQARTVKDYWDNILSPAAQGQLFGNDYAPLPNAIRTIAQTGVNAINWNKGEGGKDDDDDDKKDGDDDDKTTPPPGKPSNMFSLPRKTISSKTGGATISVKLPGPGKVELVGTANVPNGKAQRRPRKAIKVGRTVLDANRGGTFSLKLKPSAAAMKRLRKKGKLRVNLKVTFTPDGGTARTTNGGITLKLKKRKSGQRQ